MTSAGIVIESHIDRYYSLDQLEGGKNLPNSTVPVQLGETLWLLAVASELLGLTHRKRVKMIPSCDRTLDVSRPERVG